jgi:hypothetical protein
MSQTSPKTDEPETVTPATTPEAVLAELNRRFEAREVRDEPYGLMVDHLRTLACPDGFSVSVQASRTHYCLPRDCTGPYYKVECGFPSAPMPTLAEWIEGGDIHATQTVWGYVPIEKVAEVLAAHGGLLSEPDAAAVIASASA